MSLDARPHVPRPGTPAPQQPRPNGRPGTGPAGPSGPRPAERPARPSGELPRVDEVIEDAEHDLVLALAVVTRDVDPASLPLAGLDRKAVEGLLSQASLYIDFALGALSRAAQIKLPARQSIPGQVATPDELGSTPPLEMGRPSGLVELSAPGRLGRSTEGVGSALGADAGFRLPRDVRGVL